MNQVQTILYNGKIHTLSDTPVLNTAACVATSTANAFSVSSSAASNTDAPTACSAASNTDASTACSAVSKTCASAASIDDTEMVVEALAIQDGRIVAVGSNDAVLALKGEETQVIDLEGRCVVPGLVDSHMHMVMGEEVYHRLDLSSARSCEDIIRLGRHYLDEHPLKEGQWLIGNGYNQDRFDVPVLPDVQTADAISTEVPVLLDRVCSHIATANHVALSIAGFDENTVIQGGSLDKGPDGKLNGILREGGLDTIKKFIPRLDPERIAFLVKSAGDRMAASGLTGVHSDDLGPEGTTWDLLKTIFADLEAKGTCPLRLWEEWENPRPEFFKSHVLAQGDRSFQGSDYLKLGNVKLLADGSLGARTAYLREDYSDDPGNRGIAVYTQEELDEMVRLCHENDLQCACHCIGDGAAQQFIDAVRKVMTENPKDLHHRIVHCQFGDDGLYDQMAELGIGADTQPPFIPTDAQVVLGHMGPERTGSSYAWKTLLEKGILCGGGSDYPVEPFSPLYGIHCAVNRPDTNDLDHAGVFRPDQCLTVRQALELYTMGPARLVHAEKDLGSLEVGKLADLVVLSEDLFSVPTQQIRHIYPVITMVGGRITYQA